MLSMPMPARWMPNRDSHVPALVGSSLIASAIAFAWLGNAEMRYSLLNELSASR